MSVAAQEFRWTVAAQPRDVCAIARRVQCRQDGVPGAHVVGPAVQENHGKTCIRPGDFVTDLQQGGVDRAQGNHLLARLAVHRGCLGCIAVPPV